MLILTLKRKFFWKKMRFFFQNFFKEVWWSKVSAIAYKHVLNAYTHVCYLFVWFVLFSSIRRIWKWPILQKWQKNRMSQSHNSLYSNHVRPVHIAMSAQTRWFCHGGGDDVHVILDYTSNLTIRTCVSNSIHGLQWTTSQSFSSFFWKRFHIVLPPSPRCRNRFS